MKWKAKATAAQSAKEELPALAAEYFDAGRDAVKHKRPARELHRFRVRTKIFRYALELFLPVYGPELKQRLELLRHLQTILGKISDTYSIRELLKGDPARGKQLRQQGQAQIEEFREYWVSTFDGPNELTAWREALSQPQSAPKKKTAKKSKKKRPVL